MTEKSWEIEDIEEAENSQQEQNVPEDEEAQEAQDEQDDESQMPDEEQALYRSGAGQACFSNLDQYRRPFLFINLFF